MGELKFYKRRRKISRQKKIRVLIYSGICILVVLFAVLQTLAFGKKYNMNDSSMAPTIEHGQTLLVDRLKYRLFSPDRNDIIVYSMGSGPRTEYSIKRIVAVPGDLVLISKGKIYVNDKEVELKANTESIKNAGIYEEEQLIPEGQYFVMGDNCNNSEDSRFEGIGCISKDNIYGKVWFKAGPFPNIGLLL